HSVRRWRPAAADRSTNRHPTAPVGGDRRRSHREYPEAPTRVVHLGLVPNSKNPRTQEPKMLWMAGFQFGSLVLRFFGHFSRHFRAFTMVSALCFTMPS